MLGLCSIPALDDQPTYTQVAAGTLRPVLVNSINESKARLSPVDAISLVNVTYPALDGLLVYTRAAEGSLHTVI